MPTGSPYRALDSELPQHQLADVGIGVCLAAERAFLRAEQDAALGVGDGGSAVGAFDQHGVERNALGGEVEVQFDWVVTGLVVDIDGAGKLGSVFVVEPI